MKGNKHMGWLASFSTLISLSLVGSSAAAYTSGIQAAPLTDIMRVALEDLSDADVRRLDFYADKIVDAVTTLADAEATGDTTTIERDINIANDLAARYVRYCRSANLTDSEISQFFLTDFMDEYRGRIPNILLNAEGTFDVNTLLFGSAAAIAPQQTDPDAYVDLLRSGPVGGVTPGN